ncbi:hypothetical protein HDU67_008436 [Dinochytrium kinnereticum]|nr:hypothetical protein HDU67_008436 [Dinochytrium kinnereticum]
MKVKRSKTYKRIMGVYCRSFGFREPYQILLDGNFIQVALEIRMDPRDMLPKILSGTVRPMTTACVQEELKSLGEDFRGALINSRRIERRRCPHDKAVPASECLASIIGEDNKHKYGVATQDVGLRRSLRRIPGTPLIYINNGMTLLEPPSIETKNRSAEMEKSKGVAKVPKLVEAEKENSTPVPKRKKPQAPNPLSVKKKKPPTVSEIAKAFQKRAKEGNVTLEEKLEEAGGKVNTIKKAKEEMTDVEQPSKEGTSGTEAISSKNSLLAEKEDEKANAEKARKRNRRKPKKRIGEGE